MPSSPRTNPYAEVYRAFRRNTADHVLEVLHNDGLYRHLRIREPGTMMWHFDLITWPGHLATAGDVADGYTFSRVADMLDFFTLDKHQHSAYSDGAPSIDIRYWAEKLNGGRSHQVTEHSPKLFMREVSDALEENEELSADTKLVLRDEARWVSEEEHTAFSWLQSNEQYVGSDTWEWNFRDYDFHFVLTCYCIAHGVQLYLNQRDEPETEKLTAALHRKYTPPAPGSETPECLTCRGSGAAVRGWGGEDSPDGRTCPDCRGTGEDTTAFGVGSDHCPHCGADWKAPHTTDCTTQQH